MQKKHKIITAGFIATMLISSSFCSAKPSLKIPETFTVGTWVGAKNDKDEKKACKLKQIMNDEVFFLKFNSKTNSYENYGWEYNSDAKKISLSIATPIALRGKARFTYVSQGEVETETAEFDFFIKNDRLYSKYFEGRAKKFGLYHCR